MFALRTSARADWRSAFEAALDSAHATSDLRAEAWLLHSLGEVHAAGGDFAAAIACYERALANQLTLGRVRAAAASVNDIAAVYYEQGRYAEALAQFRRATDMVRQEPGPGYLIGVFLANQAECLDAMGRYESALELYDQALEVARESGDRPSLAANMSLRAQTLRRLGRLEEALNQHRAALALHRELGGVGADFVTALGRVRPYPARSRRTRGRRWRPGGKPPPSPRASPTRGPPRSGSGWPWRTARMWSTDAEANLRTARVPLAAPAWPLVLAAKAGCAADSTERAGVNQEAVEGLGPVRLTTITTSMCSRLANGPATMFTPCFSARSATCGPISSSTAFVLALLVGHTSAEWVPSTTKCIFCPPRNVLPPLLRSLQRPRSGCQGANRQFRAQVRACSRNPGR